VQNIRWTQATSISKISYHTRIETDVAAPLKRTNYFQHNVTYSNMASKILLTIIAVLFVCGNCYSQRIRSKSGRFEYIRLPIEPLPDNFKTFKVVPVYPASSGVYENEVMTQQLKKIFKLESFKSVEENPDLIIQVKLKDFVATNPQLQQKPVALSVEQKMEYYYTVNYQYPMSAIVIDRVTQVEIFNGASNESGYVYSTGAYPTTNQLSAVWGDGFEHHRKMKEDAFSKNTQQLKNEIQSKYDFTPVTIFQEVWAPKTTKKQNYADLDSAQMIAVKAYELIRPNSKNGFDSFRNGISLSVDIWLRALKESNLENDKARINSEVVSSIRYNLAHAYFWLDDLEKAKEQVAIAQTEFKETYWVEKLLKDISDKEARKKAAIH
jgi:hypothetical protein